MWAIGFPGACPDTPLTARGLIAKARQLGVGVVQFGPNLKFGREDCRLAHEQGLQVEIGTVSLDLEEQIAQARAAGASLLRTVLEEEGPLTLPLDAMEKRLRSLVPLLEEHQIRLALENSIIPARDLCALLKRIGHPALGVTLDTANSLAISEGWRQVLAELAPFTFCLHVKDYDVRREWHRMGFRVEGRPAGQGQLDIPYLLEILRQAGASCNAILELWTPQQATLAETIALEDRWARESILYLRTLIKE
jgi:sugar phosphate isomerase/epimerase